MEPPVKEIIVILKKETSNEYYHLPKENYQLLFQLLKLKLFLSKL